MARKQPVVRDILFATDFSPQSEEAGRLAAAYARALGSRLHILHIAASRHGSHEQRARKLAGQIGRGLETITAVEVGTPAPRISRYAADHDIGLIVVGTHGRTGFSKAILGSVAELLTRTAPSPVLTVPPMAKSRIEEETPADDAGALRRCVVCARPSEDLICTGCRDRIRAEAFDQKLDTERKARV
jgi:nucleotide-binding universal stress UspA family protein